MVLTIILTIVILLGGGLSERHFRGRRCYWRGMAMESAAGRSKDAQNSTITRKLARSLAHTQTHTTLSPSLSLYWESRLHLDDFFSWATFIGLDVRSYSTYKSRHVLATIPSFIGLAYQGPLLCLDSLVATLKPRCENPGPKVEIPSLENHVLKTIS